MEKLHSIKEHKVIVKYPFVNLQSQKSDKISRIYNFVDQWGTVKNL